MLNEQTILHWFDDVLAFMQQGKLAPWAAVLPQQLQQILQEKEHGDQQRWLDAVAALPEIDQVQANLTAHDLGLHSPVITAEQEQQLHSALRGLMP